ncbi:MAG: chromosome partitioning protein ParB family [Rhodospirillaceae bacterium]|nr:MAG: chromosome partitioning protein ParB family [Rhodospirillaceae bacterium]
MRKDKLQRLGRGLSSLLGDDEIVEPIRETRESTQAIPVDFLQPGRFQPRRHFDAGGIASLVDSIRRRGILQPILVRSLAEQPGHYEIIAGERRWRAAQQAQLREVPIIVRELSDKEALEVGLVENLQRQDLSPLEEAEGYSRLVEEFHHTQEELSQAVSKSRSHVANMMRLLVLPDPIKEMLDHGTLSAGHARALLGAQEPVKLAQSIVSRGLNVRQTEKMVQKEGGKIARKAEHAARTRDADLIALERDISNRLGLKVSLSFGGQGGELTIHYRSLEQLDDILLRLNAPGSPLSPPPPAYAHAESEAMPEDSDGTDDGTETDMEGTPAQQQHTPPP